METALDGIKVLEVGNRIAGLYCTKILSDYGADVIKVETPGHGDAVRSMWPFPDDKPDPETSGFFLYLNTNKRSITLNLKSAAGVSIFKNLVKLADAVVENFSPPLMPSLGLDYETLKNINPQLVMTSISGFGQTGPYRDYEVTDLIAWAMSGILYETGDADKEPLKMGSNETEYMAGLFGALSTLAALYYRDEGGAGQHLDLAQSEAFTNTEPYMTILYSQLGGLVRQRAGIHWPWGIHPCQDGYVGFFFAKPADWDSLCVLIERPDLLDKPGFATPFERDAQPEELASIVSSWLKDKRVEEVFHAAQELRLPLTPVPDMSQLIHTAQHKARGYFVEIDHPVAGRLTYPGPPFRLSETPWRAGCAPLLGEHNQEVYCGWLGHSKQHLVILREQGVI